MDIQDLLFKLGIPTCIYSVETTLTGSLQEKIGDTLEVTVGHVYGMSVDIGGTTSQSTVTNNILTADTVKLWLNLKYGQSIYVNNLRLDHLVFSEPAAASSGYSNPQKYLPVNIPVGTDLKQSYYQNPSLLTTPKTVTLNLFYIDKTAYKNLVDQKLVMQNGLKTP